MLREDRISHVHTSAFITCHALRPRRSLNTCLISVFRYCIPYYGVSLRSQNYKLTRLNHLTMRLTAYDISCLRLIHYITIVDPRLDIQCVGHTSIAALSAASTCTLRGAPIRFTAYYSYPRASSSFFNLFQLYINFFF